MPPLSVLFCASRERLDLHVFTPPTFVHRCERDVADAAFMRCRRHLATPERAVVSHDCSRTTHHHASVARCPSARTSKNGASLVNAVWIVLGIGVAVAVLMLTTSWRRRDQEVDLGSVSHQWIAEQRMGQAHDPQR